MNNNKDAYYFSHDSNASQDPKMVKVLMDMQHAGYGLYWMIIESLRNQADYTMRRDYDAIAYALRTDSERIKNLIESYDLFILDGDYFYSESLLNRMKHLDNKRKKCKESAKKRWAKRPETKEVTTTLNADAMRTHNERNADLMQSKVNKSKVKESKVNISTTSTEVEGEEKQNLEETLFNEFWKAYPVKLGKAQAWKHWKKKKLGLKYETIMGKLEDFKTSPDWVKDNGEFIPHGSTWIYQERWQDEIFSQSVMATQEQKEKTRYEQMNEKQKKQYDQLQEKIERDKLAEHKN